MSDQHKDQFFFVGRTAELAQFDAFLRDPRGQAAVVVGQQGMGKTMLLDKFARVAAKHPDLQCAAVRYEVTATDSADAVMANMMDHAHEAAGVPDKRFLSGTDAQWKALYKACRLLPGVGLAGEVIGELLLTLPRDPVKNTRGQFLDRLRDLSARMPEGARALFLIDPEKYMQPDSHDAWRLVAKDLPDKIKFAFAQRPDDALIRSPDFMALGNVIRIPSDSLDILDDQAIEHLLEEFAPPIERSQGVTRTAFRTAILRYRHHPYATRGALDLLAKGSALADLPQDPTPTGVAKAQWQRACAEGGPDAIHLFEAYAILEVPVPDSVVVAVSGLDAARRKAVIADAYRGGLLRRVSGARIYHSLLSDHILGQIASSDAETYHHRAIDIYRKRLTADLKPDGLAAERLPPHVMKAEGNKAYVLSLVNECTPPLLTLGLFDVLISFSHHALSIFPPHSIEAAVLQGNLGNVYQTRGALDEAEAMFKKSLAIEEKLGRLVGMAIDYGNLGNVYQTRGALGEAEAMYKKALAINEKLGRLVGMANQYGNLGIVYKMRGALDEAEAMYKKSLAIEEKLGRLEGMATDYGNLGNVYKTRGALDEAEAMYKKSLAINEKLGRLVGMANQFGNLGNVYQLRGDMSQAREYWTKSRDLYARIGIPHMVAKVQAWLDGLDQ